MKASFSTSNRTPINRDKYPYKVCSASLPRPKLKRLKSNSQNPKNSHPRPGPASAKNKETHINIDRDRVFGVMENTDLGHDRHHVNNRSRSSKDVTMTQNNYYNLYGSPIPSGEILLCCINNTIINIISTILSLLFQMSVILKFMKIFQVLSTIPIIPQPLYLRERTILDFHITSNLIHC